MDSRFEVIFLDEAIEFLDEIDQKARKKIINHRNSNVTIGTVLKVFEALKAKVNFKVEMMNKTLKIV